jgi:hypothetical protein
VRNDLLSRISGAALAQTAHILGIANDLPGTDGERFVPHQGCSGAVFFTATAFGQPS